jgi:hypothetical protein
MHAGYTTLLERLASSRAPDPIEQQGQEINLNTDMDEDADPSDIPIDLTQPLFVPLMSAPFQTQFQPGESTKTIIAQRVRLCANAPHCQRLAKDCGGWMSTTCENYNSICPRELELLPSVRAARKNEKRKQERQQEREQQRQQKKNNTT